MIKNKESAYYFQLYSADTIFSLSLLSLYLSVFF